MLAHSTALVTLFSSPSPPHCYIRPLASSVILYGFGDASGSGFGSTLSVYDMLHYQHGQWDPYIEDNTSSNYKELLNSVVPCEEAAQQGLLHNCELFMFTDNSTTEVAFNKVNSSNKHLFALDLRLQKLQMDTGIHIHIVYVSGTRMIAQGADALSWLLLIWVFC